MGPQKRLMHRLWAAQQGRCFICGGAMWPGWVSGDACIGHNRQLRPTLDHVTPLSKGGADSWRNSLLAHEMCNRGKSNRRPHPCELLMLSAITTRFPPYGREDTRNYHDYPNPSG